MAKRRDIEADTSVLKSFLTEFYSHSQETGEKVFKYRDALTKIAHREQVQVEVDMDDVSEYDPDLYLAMKSNTNRYQKIIEDLIDAILPELRTKDVAYRDNLDVYIRSRIMLRDQRREENPDEVRDPSNIYPKQLLRRFEVVFKTKSDEKSVMIRKVNASTIGKLIAVKGIVTKATAVKPLMQVATYVCTMCTHETYQPINSLNFTPREFCESKECKTNKTGGRLNLQNRASKYTKFQEVKIQEHTDEVPVGHIPRSLTVLAIGEVTRQAQPGDHVQVTGVYLPMAGGSGFAKMNSGLKYNDTYLEAHRIVQMNKSQESEMDSTDLTQEELDQLGEDLYDRLAISIAPEIYGHEDIKKALLILLVGGKDQVAEGSLKIRGCTHILLMGDPGVAKSQLLGFVDRLAPRSQYTTGRGSSGVGLTASVAKDPITGEFVLEGGALVLADRGICCIDEFDKMHEGDRTSIHEVMEQQTISIAKAGIMTSLNARVSILAAANPAFGRYNPKKTIEQNVQLPAALLSRFDLLWLIQDKASRENDLKLANHIAYVHQHNKNPPLQFEPIPVKLMRKYLKAARATEPSLPKDLTEHLANAYVTIREDSRNNKNATFTSARTLLSIIRMSTALAKLRLGAQVEKFDIDEALRLMEMSKDTLAGDDSDSPRVRSRPVDQIYKIVVEMMQKSNTATHKIDDIIRECGRSGFTQDQIMEAIEEYESLNVWLVNTTRTKITRVF